MLSHDKKICWFLDFLQMEAQKTHHQGVWMEATAKRTNGKNGEALHYDHTNEMCSIA